MGDVGDVGDVAGLLLAAGAGRRMGLPKALVRVGAEPLVQRGWRALGDAGLARRVVVLGAGHDAAAAALPDDADVVVATGWETGMGASLRAGLAALTGPGAPAVRAVVVTLVDMPDIGARAVRRVAEAAAGPTTLARGSFAGVPGHPVLLGRAHWDAVADAARGDVGARGYLRGRDDVVPVEISDVAGPRELDRPADLAQPRR